MMNKLILATLLLTITVLAKGQERFPANQISINAFRNPSIGLEYHRRQISLHGGYYVTNFESGVTTEFLKAGITCWFLPWGRNKVPSSFYAGSSYLRGLTREYRNKNAVAVETGVRLMIWKGLNFRFGVVALAAEGRSLKINPTPAISYSISL